MIGETWCSLQLGGQLYQRISAVRKYHTSDGVSNPSASLIFLHKILVPAALNIRVSRAAPLADWILLCFSFLGASERHEWLCSSQHGAEDAPPRTGNMEEWARKGRGCADLLYFNNAFWKIALCNMILLSYGWMSVLLCVCAHSLLLILHIRAALISNFYIRNASIDCVKGEMLLVVNPQKILTRFLATD